MVFSHFIFINIIIFLNLVKRNRVQKRHQKFYVKEHRRQNM